MRLPGARRQKMATGGQRRDARRTPVAGELAWFRLEEFRLRLQRRELARGGLAHQNTTPCTLRSMISSSL